MAKSNSTFDRSFKKYAKWTLLAIMLVCILPYLFTRHGLIDFRETGQIGDTIGGIMGPFVAIIAAILTFLAFWVQYKANEQQRRDMAIERFENNLFQMISQQEEITNNLRYTSEGSPEVLASGRHVFEYIYLHRQRDWHKGLKMTIIEDGLEGMTKDNSIWCLDHYFRHLYRIFKYVDEVYSSHGILKEINERYEYTSIVRSMLSEYELVLLFYNAMAYDRSDKFKRLIERYAILNNLRFDLLARLPESVYYKRLYDGNPIQMPDMLVFRNYSKKAFMFEN